MASSTRNEGSRRTGAGRPSDAGRRTGGGERRSSRRDYDGYEERGYSSSGRRTSSSGRRDPRDDRRSASGGRKGQARRKKKQTRRIILFSVEILALVVLALVLWAVGKQDAVQHITINESQIVENMNEGVEENETMQGYRNVALFGVDARDDDLKKGNRSDTIMIASINQDTDEVKLVSVYRDTYLNLSNDTYNKCNAAYAAGGPEQAILMLNMNLDLNITEYISINFNGLIELVDSLGGVQIDVQPEEIEHLNNYQKSMFSTESKVVLTDDYTPVTKSGLQTLNGMQATAYCRIRATAGDDFRRAERQRTVLLACLDKAKSASFSQLESALDSVLPHVATNLDTAEILSVLQEVANYSVTATDGFPFEDTRTTGTLGSKGSCVIPVDLETNVIKLHNFLFEQEEYTPSEQVKSYSAKISSDTGY
ncbi:MAG TPA: LCP family protein [Candidatus Eisenbergiella intestinipullorum]|nr:LCP family protein [Candidatus Eisenbergiella intestinipullorum]